MATFVEINPSLIPNTVMRQRMDEATGEPMTYRIKPIEGYVLHDKQLEFPEIDMETGFETGVTYRGYSASEISCWHNYDFTNTTTIDGYTAYGSREFFARPESEVPSNQIFGGGNEPEHEVM